MFARHRRVAAPATSGFTLVELLVVVGIVAVLAAILLPAVARVRASANGAACLANLRQLHLLSVQAMQSRDGVLIAAPDVDPDSSWVASLGLAAPADRSSVSVCPAVTGFAEMGTAGRPDYMLAGEGSATLGWNESFDEVVRRGAYGWNAAVGGVRVSRITRSVEVPLFADSARSVGTVTADADAADLPPPGTERHYLAHGGFWIDRHAGGGINAVFVDGHAGRVPLSELRTLRWRPQ
jgi:prepilin-type N-terminal cleavage/methylation domain-containing protein/prepilin-type processing-associated H-X9-DG protein